MEVRSYARQESRALSSQGGGMKLNKVQYPRCPNHNCKYKLIDGPPSNVTATQSNKDAIQAYGDICDAFKLFEKGLGPQPRDPDVDDLVTKMPSAPKPITRYLRYHCHQNRANPRTGQKCAVDCFYNGQCFSIGKYPLCLCVCNAFVLLKDYHTIVTVSTLPNQQRTGES